MKIKSEKTTPLSKSILSFIKKSKSKLIIVAFYIISVSAVGLGGIYYGTKLSTSENSAIFASFYRYFKPSINIVDHFFKGVFANPNSIDIHMDHIDYQKLAFLVDKSKRQGIISPEFKQEVDALIVKDDVSYKANIKIRGTFLEHVRSDKWSLRINMKGDNTLFGMERFSISSPETRNHIHEWLFQRALSNEGLINLRYEFINVKLNGKNLGIYAIEEFFDKRLIENNKLREGIIIKPMLKDSTGYLNVYQKNKTLSNESLNLSYINVLNKIKEFQERNLKASAVFDIEKSAKYFALSSIFGGQHGHIPINFVCYFNPITNLLEPIGYDSNVSRKIERYGGMITSKTNTYNSQIFYPESILQILFDSDEFYQLYIKHLNRIIDRFYVDDLINKNKVDLDKSLNILYKEYFYFDYFKRDYFRSNREYITKNLKTNENVNANILGFYEEGEKINIALDNLKDIKIEIIDVIINNDSFVPQKSIIVNSTRLDEKYFFTLKKEKLNINVTNDYSESPILRFKVFGLDAIHEIPLNSNIKAQRNDEYIFNKQGNIDLFDFVLIDNNKKEIKIKSGEYELSQDLVIPNNFKFIIEKNIKINLINQANIVSFSPIYFKGEKLSPIQIFSSNSSGQGVSVISAKNKSYISYTIFNNLSNPQKTGISQLGAVNFYESPVTIDHMEISNNRSEDAINIFRSDYLISFSKFTNIFSDAFDGDFSNGTLNNNQFYYCGNDAVDVSGSSVIIDSLYIENIKDKGISVGENSQLTGKNLFINNTEIAITSKDLSVIDLHNINISNSRIAFTAYQKKPEYGPAKILASNYKKSEVEKDFLIESKSSMTLDSNVIPTIDTKVEDLLYGNVYGKSSK